MKHLLKSIKYEQITVDAQIAYAEKNKYIVLSIVADLEILDTIRHVL